VSKKVSSFVVSIALAASAAVAVSAFAAKAPGGARSISVKDLKAHVAFLSADRMAGRDTGEPGLARAEEYIAAALQSYGLRPVPGADDFFLDFPLYRTAYDMDETSVRLSAGGETRTGTAGQDMRPFGFSDDGTVEAPVVFAGYGITSEEHAWDDYADLDVEGKIVLLLRHEPGEKDPQSSFDGTSSTDHATFARKAQNAEEHGARGMILLTDPLHHEPGDDLRILGRLRLDPPADEDDGDEETAEEEQEEPFLAVHVSRELASFLVAPAAANDGAGMKALETLQTAVDEGRKPAELPLGEVTARISVRSREAAEEVAARDVAGFLEGSDPELKHEWIVIGGHHDHIGAFRGSGDTVFNGADDNASGTSGVLELAQAFASLEERPRRSLVFTTFSAEERGLLGSRAMVEKALIPIERVVFMMNLDMIGRNPARPVQVFGDGFVRGLKETVEAANAELGHDVEFGGTGYAGNSDHDSFYRRDIPFLFFFTGTHEDYHQLGDHANKLAYANMRSILRLAYGVTERLANADDKPVFVHNIDWLGARVEVLGSGDARAATVTAVEDASRAQEFGLRVGDTLLAFGEDRIADPGNIGKHFREIEPGNQVAVTVGRDGGERELTLERARVGYMGVFPGPVDEDLQLQHGLRDDEGIVLRQVVADGPCGKAGLQQGDIVVRISGSPIGPNNLRSRLSQIGAGETVTMAVIRDGERLEIEVTLGERPQRRP
jgi:hypothetical protein